MVPFHIFFAWKLQVDLIRSRLSKTSLKIGLAELIPVHLKYLIISAAHLVRLPIFNDLEFKSSMQPEAHEFGDDFDLGAEDLEQIFFWF